VSLWANFCRGLRAMLRCVLCRTGLAARGPLFMSGQGEPEHGQGLRSHAEYGARVLPTNASQLPHRCNGGRSVVSSERRDHESPKAKLAMNFLSKIPLSY
jgi:hypothetical protein